MDDADLERLYARLEQRLYNVVYRWVWNADEAQDLVQEAFLRLWRMRGRIDPARAEALAYRIALNLAASRLRRRKVWRWLGLEALDLRPGAPGPEAGLAREEERARVRAAVAALPDKLRAVVLLCEFSDLTHEQIAVLLGIPPGTVGSRRHRALERLRRTLADEGRVIERAGETGV